MPKASSEAIHAAAADLAACRAMLRGGSRTFYAASFLLPGKVRDPAIALYAFCRQADDAIDLGDEKRDALAALRGRLARAYEGRPLPLPADRAFADTVAKFAIPCALPEALLEGLAWDALGRRYRTMSELHAYAVRVAGSVGVMMALLMGERRPDVLRQACDLGVAMQLTNIARDVGEDARAGRLYIPLEWLDGAGVDVGSWLRQPAFDERIRSLVQRLLTVAELHYERAGIGIAQLPWSCRPGIMAARLLYAEIGRQVERNGLDSVSRRAVVSTPLKLTRLLHVVPQLMSRARSVAFKALPEAEYLINAVALSSPARAASRNPAPAARGVEQRVVWVIELFERLAREEQLVRSAD